MGSGKCPRCGKEFDQEVGVPYVDSANRKIWLCTEQCAFQYPMEQLKKKGLQREPDEDQARQGASR